MLFRERILEASKFIAGSIRSCCTLRLVVHKTTFQLKFIYRYIDRRDSRRNFPRNGAYLLATGGGIVLRPLPPGEEILPGACIP